MNKKQYRQCQSCGMPLNKDRNGGGTEKDGSRSGTYCSSCYENGQFLQPDLTLTQMQEKVDAILRDEMKSGRLFRWLAKKQLPRLLRWR